MIDEDVVAAVAAGAVLVEQFGRVVVDVDGADAAGGFGFSQRGFPGDEGELAPYVEGAVGRGPVLPLEAEGFAAAHAGDEEEPVQQVPGVSA